MTIVSGGIIIVGIGELFATTSPTKLQALGLGSCVGVALYDPVTKVGGLAHVMMPESNGSSNELEENMDTAVANLLSDMQNLLQGREYCGKTGWRSFNVFVVARCI